MRGEHGAPYAASGRPGASGPGACPCCHGRLLLDAGHTKLDRVRYYLSVAEGALRRVAGRPMVLKRFVKGIGEEAVF